MLRLAAVLFICLLITGCGGGGTIHDGPSLSVTQLQLVPEQVDIKGSPCRIGQQTSLYRNFISGDGESGGDSLVATVVITCLDPRPVTFVTPTHLWLINGEEVWESDIPGDEPVARGGPKWSPGSRVDVVVRVADGDGAEYLVRAHDRLVTGIQ